jgi:hypothetical protein
MSSSDLIWWAAILLIQAILANSKTRSLGFLRAFLGVEATMGAILLTIAKAGGVWTYFYAWIAATVIHHALCAYLVGSLFTIVMRRGLPGRQSPVPLFLMSIVSMGLGLRFAEASYSLLHCAPARLIFPMDHALSFAIASMVAFLPIYSIAISATIPSAVKLIIGGFAIYEFAYVGWVSSVIVYNRIFLPHAVDIVYLASLVCWFIAIRSKRPKVVEERIPIAA